MIKVDRNKVVKKKVIWWVDHVKLKVNIKFWMKLK